MFLYSFRTFIKSLLQDSVRSLTPDACNDVNEESAIISISTTFGPTANLLPIPPDLILMSSDTVFFYLHTAQLLTATTNHFNGLCSQARPTRHPDATEASSSPEVVSVPESSAVLNIILHASYDLSCAHYNPSLDALIAAVDAMPIYGLSSKQHVAPNKPLFTLLLARAPIQPISVYALAGAYDLAELATPVSAHLLSFPLHTLPDALAYRMGPIYLKRLFFLHVGRIHALRRLLVAPPHPHPPTDECDFTEQKKLTRAWALASAYLAWDARPGKFGGLFSPKAHLTEHRHCRPLGARYRKRAMSARRLPPLPRL